MAIIDPLDPSELSRFVAFERELLVGTPFVPEPDIVLQQRLSGSAACLSATTCARRLLGAYEDGRLVARCAALINRRWQDVDAQRRGTTGFIGYFAAASQADEQVRDMLAEAEDWLASHGIDRVIVGCNGNALLGLGILTAGFDDYEPMFPLNWNPPTYGDYLDAAGYERSLPWWVYEVDLRTPLYQRFRCYALSAPTCEVRPLDVGRYADEIELLRGVFNDGFRGEWEMQQFTKDEFWELFGWMQDVIDPETMWFAYVPEETAPVGFAYGFADWSPSFRGLQGQLPHAEFLYRLAREPITRAGGIAYACRPGFTNRRIGPRLAVALYSHFERLGLRSAFYYPVNDHNRVSRTVATRLGGRGRVLYHCFTKTLPDAR